MHYKTFFNSYVNSIFEIESDLTFWKHFLSISIERYKQDNPENRMIFDALFSMYDLPPDGKNGWLKTFDKTFSIEINDLDEHRNNLFAWIMNLSIVRIYNSVELLLLKSIQHKFFPNLGTNLKEKRQLGKVIEEIKTFLKENGEAVDTTNNRYLITFIKHYSSDFKSFLGIPIKEDWKTNWGQFYEFISILRNIMAHQAMVITPNLVNQLKSISLEMYIHHFQQPSFESEDEILKPKDQPTFLYLINQTNSFTGNTVKFIAEEKDLKFLDLLK